jgi:pSer/pThr/pTyr-binding forkhead associated (FHA) protein
VYTLKEALELVRGSGAWNAADPVLLFGFRTATSSARQFRTKSAESDPPSVPSLRLVVADAETVVAPVVKRAGNPYGEFIFVGRAVTSDIVIDDPSISKSHAAFRRDPSKGGGWFVKDNRSRNGTYLDGEKLESSSWVAITSGAQITFGGVAAYFVDAEALAALAR